MESPLTLVHRGFDTRILSGLGENERNTYVNHEKLQPETLVLLLLELVHQNSDPENQFTVLDIKELVGSICSHLDTIMKFVEVPYDYPAHILF